MVTEPTTLILLPGIDGTDVFFRPLVAALPEWVKPIVVTYPGTGSSAYEDLLEIVLDAVGDARQFWVLGWSFGGPLALMLAAREPDRTNGVILCASFVSPPRPGLVKFRFAAVAPVIWALRILRRTPAFIFGYPTDSVRRDKAETWSRVPSHAIAARARAILRADVRDILRRCDKPVVYLAGSLDTAVPRHNADEVARHQPSARIVTIEGDHMAMYMNPRAAADAITEVMRADASV